MLSLPPNKRYKHTTLMQNRITVTIRLALFIIICAYYDSLGYSGIMSFFICVATCVIADIGLVIVRGAISFLGDVVDRIGL